MGNYGNKKVLEKYYLRSFISIEEDIVSLLYCTIIIIIVNSMDVLYNIKILEYVYR